MKKIYLAHSVHERSNGKRIAKELINKGFEVYNPFYPSDPRGDIKALDDGHIQPWDIRDLDRSEWIIKVDLEALRKCDIFVAIYPDGITVGIPCEMTYSWLNHIPIYSLVPERLTGHPWIVGMSKGITTDEEELLGWLIDYES